MSGISGLWQFEGKLETNNLQAMSRALAHRGKDGEHFFVDSHLGLACQQMWVTPEEQGEVQPVTDERGFTLVSDGRIFNRKDLAAEFGPSFHAEGSDARYIFEAY